MGMLWGDASTKLYFAHHLEEEHHPEGTGDSAEFIPGEFRRFAEAVQHFTTRPIGRTPGSRGLHRAGQGA